VSGRHDNISTVKQGWVSNFAASGAPLLRRRFANESDAARAEAEAAAAVLDARRAHSRLRDAIDILPEGIVFLDADGRYILWNQQYAKIYKRSADLFQPGAKLAETLRVGVERGDYPEAEGRREEWIQERLDKLFNPDGAHEQTLADGRTILIEERRTSDGGIIGLRVDITEMKKREASFRLLFDGNPVPMFVYALDDLKLLAVNDAAVEHYGYDRSQFLGMGLRDIHDPADQAGLQRAADGNRDEQSGWTWRHRKANGDMIDVAIFQRQLTYEGRKAAMIAAIDITERKQAEARVAFMAHHDALTALPNRILLRLRMEDMVAHLRRSGRGFAVLCVDLDNFKWVNDTLGHPFGDVLLQSVANRLRAELREIDTIARLGGDEFAILQADVSGPEEVSRLLARLLAVIAEPYDLEGHSVTIGASIGVALAPDDGGDPDRLLKNAESRYRRGALDGSADPLAASAARHGLARRLYSAGRGDRIDRAARSVRAPPGLCRRGEMAGRGEGRCQPVADAVQERKPAAGGARRAGGFRSVADQARTGDHRDAAARQKRARACHAARIAGAGRAHFDG
jgi:diguanylate cyclase (GGDEF)-like protein/PAS domain S-box-containing protein